MKSSNRKILKRRAIAQSCSTILQEEQYHNISISKLALTAGIGKGTIYEYFENKEDIVFELMTSMQESYDKKLELLLKKTNSIEMKLNYLFMLFLDDDKIIKKQRDIYKQFLTICISNPSEKIKQYNSNIRKKYISILNGIISNKDISTNIYDSVILTFLNSITLSDYTLKDNIQIYLAKQIKVINKKGNN